jgi:replicative DNA helicase
LSNTETTLERGLLASLEAERSILGNILLNNEHYHEAAERLDAFDFAIDSHRQIYLVIEAMIEAGRSVDIVTLSEELNTRRQTASIGGVAYLASLTEMLPERPSIAEYVEIVIEKSMLRQVYSVGNTLATRALDQSESARDLIADTDQQLLAIVATHKSGELSIEQQCVDSWQEMEEQRNGSKPMMVTTGINPLDVMIGGIPKGELTILGAWPGQGKTAFIVQMLVRNGFRGIPSHFFSIEMKAKQVLRRIFAQVADLPFHQLRHPERLSREEFERVKRASQTVSQWPLIIDDSPDLTHQQMVARLRISKRRQKTEFAAIDYLQKIHFAADSKFRHIDVSDACVAAARVAKQEDIALLLLSSLTEKTGKNANDAPTMGDLRQSGDIQFEGSNILLLHRKRDGDDGKLQLDGDLIVAKARNDETGNIRIHFSPDMLRFEEIVPPMFAGN